MGTGEPGHPDVVRPAWLPERPHNGFQKYAPGLEHHTIYAIWYLTASETGTCMAVYDVHKAALEGHARYLKVMQKFMLALTTERLKR